MPAEKNRQAILATVAVVALLIAGGLIVGRGSSGGAGDGPKHVYFYALNTGDLFTAPNTATTAPAPAGGEGVRAYVYSCTSCDDAASRFAGYVQKYTEQAVAAMANPSPETEDALREGNLVASPAEGGELKWVAADSDAGQRIQNAPFNKCAELQPCEP